MVDAATAQLVADRWGASALYGIRLADAGQLQTVACKVGQGVVTVRTIAADGTVNDKPGLTEIPDDQVAGLTWLALRVGETLLVEGQISSHDYRLVVMLQSDDVADGLRRRSSQEAQDFVLLHRVRVLTGLGLSRAHRLLQALDRSQTLLIVGFARRLLAAYDGGILPARQKIDDIMANRNSMTRLKQVLGPDFVDITDLPHDRRFRVLRGAKLTLAAMAPSRSSS